MTDFHDFGHPHPPYLSVCALSHSDHRVSVHATQTSYVDVGGSARGEQAVMYVNL